MSLKKHRQAVAHAEQLCQAQTETARAARISLGRDFRTAATPWRIVVVGAIAGFFAGRSGADTDIGGVANKLLASASQALVNALGASVVAGLEAGAMAETASAPATTNAVPETAGAAAPAESG